VVRNRVFDDNTALQLTSCTIFFNPPGVEVETPGGYWNWCNISVKTDSNGQKLGYERFDAIAAPWVRRIISQQGRCICGKRRAHDYLIDRPESEDIGAAINAVMKAIADENEELGGALPRNYNSLKKPILRELFKILNLIPRHNISDDAFGEIYQYFVGKFAHKEGRKDGEFFTLISLVKLIVDVIEPNWNGRIKPPNPFIAATIAQECSGFI